MKIRRKLLRTMVLCILLLLIIGWLLTDLYIIDTGFETKVAKPIFNDAPRLGHRLALQSDTSKFDIAEVIELRLYLGILSLNPNYDGVISLNMESDWFVVEPAFPLYFDLSSDDYSYTDFCMEKEPSFQSQIQSIPFQLDLKLKVNLNSCPESGSILIFANGSGNWGIGTRLYFYRTDSRIYFSTKSIEDAKARGRIVP